MEEVQIIRSKRKTVSIQITRQGALIVRAPMRMPRRDIEAFLREKAGWIQSHLDTVRAQNVEAEQMRLSQEDQKELTRQAKARIPERAAYFGRIMGVTYGRISIRCQSSRWGSCSAQGNLNFNCLLMLAPPEVLDYVVVHELAHRKQMNHSAAFWAEVERVLPDYRNRLRWLKENGGTLLLRAAAGSAR